CARRLHAPPAQGDREFRAASSDPACRTPTPAGPPRGTAASRTRSHRKQREWINGPVLDAPRWPPRLHPLTTGETVAPVADATRWRRDGRRRMPGMSDGPSAVTGSGPPDARRPAVAVVDLVPAKRLRPRTCRGNRHAPDGRE